ncbi:hypothetical protein CYMTET_3104 [Cymbomonas tetramitiformis]|uniref:Uncharacterized protein n=1 Tax=Cymbomonas tetramitiformis TaxID=36881 RepID=A0AAE0H3Y3_9CHLO|nr:hypothetical protein CYMTET_3104 [Cymbomonas tetramitiformis]
MHVEEAHQHTVADHAVVSAPMNAGGAGYSAGAPAVNTGGVHVGHPGVNYPAGGFLNARRAHVGGPIGAGYPATTVPVLAEEVHQHSVADHAVNRTWDVRSMGLAHDSAEAGTHPGLPTGAVAAGAGGAHADHSTGADAEDAKGGTSTPPVRAVGGLPAGVEVAGAGRARADRSARAAAAYAGEREGRAVRRPLQHTLQVVQLYCRRGQQRVEGLGQGSSMCGRTTLTTLSPTRNVNGVKIEILGPSTTDLRQVEFSRDED